MAGRSANAPTEDKLWSCFRYSADPPPDVMARNRIRERLVKALRQRRKRRREREVVLKAGEGRARLGGPGGNRPGLERRASLSVSRSRSRPTSAHDENILERLIEDLGALGHAGEENTVKLAYLAVTTRLFPKIVSIVPKGPSSVGKSATVDRVLSFFPAEAYLRMTGMSERVLGVLRHRLPAQDDRGVRGDRDERRVRRLHDPVAAVRRPDRLADGQTAGGQMRPLVIQKEGPAGLITTTTQVNLHPENETRLLSLPMDETREQTERVIQAYAALNGRVVNFEPWHQLHYWLADGERGVVPFGKALASLIPGLHVRLRRDWPMVLSLACAHALLHRATRDCERGRSSSRRSTQYARCARACAQVDRGRG